MKVKSKARMPESEKMLLNAQWKEVKGEENVIEGYASVFSNVDLGDDVIEPGAFTKTILERVSKGLVKFIDSHTWDAVHTLGTIISAVEDTVGLKIQAKLSNTPLAQEIKQKILEGHLDRMSIGYDAVVETWEKVGEKMIRRLKELKLYEVSVVPIAMNEGAVILGVKSVIPYQDLLTAEKTAKWEPEAAAARVKAWAGDNWTKFRKGFLHYDRSNPIDQKGYHLPIADVVDGTLTVIPAAVIKAAAEIFIKSPYSVEETAEIKRHLSRYYAQMELVAPWDMTMKAFILAQVKDLSNEDKQEIAEALKPAEPPQVALTGKSVEARGRALNLQLQL